MWCSLGKYCHWHQWDCDSKLTFIKIKTDELAAQATDRCSACVTAGMQDNKSPAIQHV